jgi:uncharacterized protein with HEPN domain
MLDAVNGIEKFIAGMNEREYHEDAKTQAAVERYLEILGEAANKLTEEFCTQHPSIQWHRIISLRNRIIHAYFEVNNSIVWNIVTIFLPELKKELEKL